MGESMDDDLFSLKGKNAVVVGGGGGIGRGLAQGLVRYGAQVGLADINPLGLETATAEIQAATGVVVKQYRVDTGLESSVEELVAKAVADMGRIHILINAQGFNVKAPATEFPLAEARSSTCPPSGGLARPWGATSPTAPARGRWTCSPNSWRWSWPPRRCW
jgi:saccharopine dehydrogenase-like NADP-dependent oxidoreductase